MLIKDQNTCDAAATAIVATKKEFIGWTTSSSNTIPGNGTGYQTGCYWNKNGRYLWFNQYGIEKKLNGITEMRVCVRQGEKIIIYCALV